MENISWRIIARSVWIAGRYAVGGWLLGSVFIDIADVLGAPTGIKWTVNAIVAICYMRVINDIEKRRERKANTDG